MKNHFFIIYCGLLMAFTAFSIDILLPAFDLISQSLNTPVEWVQMTVPTYILGFSLGQLVFGPLSDRFGRKPAIYTGISIYLLGTLFAISMPTIEGILIGRVLQGFGGAAGQVVGRAIIRDQYQGQALAQNMALAMAIFAFGPIVAPLLGYAFIFSEFWRGVFIAMFVFGSVLLAMAYKSRETLLKRNTLAMTPAVLWDSIKQVLRHPQSRYFIILSSIAMVAILNYITNAPRLFAVEYGVVGFEFALLFAITGIGIIAGQLLNRHLIGFLGIMQATTIGAVALTIVAGSVFTLAYLDLLNAYGLCALMFTFNVFYLTVFANSASLVLDPHGHIAGFTSSFMGFVTAMFGSTVTSVLAVIIAGRILPWSIVFLSVALLCLIGLLGWQIKQRLNNAVTEQ